MFDVAIIGKGPAGISAAVNAFARNKSVVIFGGDSKKVLLSPSIPNYPGLPEISGKDLMERLNEHLKLTNATIINKTVIAVYAMGNYFSIQAENDFYEAKSVILATGVDFKKSIENEDTFLGNGVSYCATCDAPLYKGKVVAVVGYNHESVEEANFLAEVCQRVYFIPMFKGNFKLKENVEIINDSPIKFEGSLKAEKLILKNNAIEADGFFVLKDSLPLTSLVPGLEVDGPHVLVDKRMETNIKGLFAAGDITGKPYQVAKAIGEGQIAALNAAEYLDQKK
ncbi:NAD(P)/FAD-dependent oxidoreductase [Caloramator australicus]|uniref:Thioredoxin reductase n=1 Tax=Caloramator australicus RC3 TaxID=857293 RepID=I7K9C8_9CLOT|nr:NAD(P)/FAD-dependent oxidoreductase [Caloramator australicus]CCJ34225.1 Thioredoxin reductase [Caloramator australicus RC3]